MCLQVVVDKRCTAHGRRKMLLMHNQMLFKHCSLFVFNALPLFAGYVNIIGDRTAGAACFTSTKLDYWYGIRLYLFVHFSCVWIMRQMKVFFRIPHGSIPLSA